VCPVNFGVGEDTSVSVSLSRAQSPLEQAGCDSPRLDAEVLLAHALGYSRSSLLADGPRLLTQAEIDRFANMLDRRQRRVPLPYIIGSREFFGLSFVVNEHVLVPRPESELLVEHTLRWSAKRRAARIVDVGTGSGCLAVAIAVNRSDAILTAIDLSAEALSVATANVARHGVQGRVLCLQSDLLTSVTGPFDLIVANPPYIKEEDFQWLEPEVRQHEPRLALDGGPDGLRYVDALLHQAREKMAVGGAVLVEIGWDQGAEALQRARDRFPNQHVTVIQDYSGNDRLLKISAEENP